MLCHPVCPINFSGNLNTRRNAKARMQRRRRAVRVDEVCRYLFPMLFILFNAWYWYYYREVRRLRRNDDRIGYSITG